MKLVKLKLSHFSTCSLLKFSDVFLTVICHFYKQCRLFLHVVFERKNAKYFPHETTEQSTVWGWDVFEKNKPKLSLSCLQGSCLSATGPWGLTYCCRLKNRYAVSLVKGSVCILWYLSCYFSFPHTLIVIHAFSPCLQRWNQSTVLLK